MTPNEQKIYAEPVDKRTSHQKHFDGVYAVFHQFYQEKIVSNLPAHERVRLMLTTRFFDDLELQKRLAKTDFGSYPSTPADKQAIAMTAYLDVLATHALSGHTNAVVDQLFTNDAEIEAELASVARRVAALEETPKQAKEDVHPA